MHWSSLRAATASRQASWSCPTCTVTATCRQCASILEFIMWDRQFVKLQRLLLRLWSDVPVPPMPIFVASSFEVLTTKNVWAQAWKLPRAHVHMFVHARLVVYLQICLAYIVPLQGCWDMCYSCAPTQTPQLMITPRSSLLLNIIEREREITSKWFNCVLYWWLMRPYIQSEQVPPKEASVQEMAV
jgi:hypothetical protein